MNVETTHDAVTGAMCVRLSNVGLPLTNALRHALYKDVPVLAVAEVTLLFYDGPLEAELLALRLGQLPIAPLLDAAGTSPHVDSAVFEINVSGELDRLTRVLSTAATCTTGNARIVHYRSDAERALACHDDGFVLAYLHPRQRLHCKFVARIGTGRTGTRWSVVKPTIKYVTDDDSVLELCVQTTGAISAGASAVKACAAINEALASIIAHRPAAAAAPS